MISETEINEGDKITTIYGKIETVLMVLGCQVVTYESAARNEWYHISKVFRK